MNSLSAYLVNWRPSLKLGRYAVIAFAVLMAIKMGWIEPLDRYRGIASSRATAEALARVTNYPEEYQAQQYLEIPTPPHLAKASLTNEETEQQEDVNVDRKMVRSVQLDLVVTNPGDTARAVRELAERSGGYLAKSYISGIGKNESASLQIRVPAAKFDAVRAELRTYATRVTSEEAEATDVTKQFVDTRASLLNLRAQETRYREILNRATTVKDVIEVTDKLGAVRGEIEKTEAEFKTISLQIATCMISVSLRTETEFKMLGIQWNPSFELKFGVRSGLESLAQYVNYMLSFVLHLPAILLWSVTIIVGIAIGWRVLKHVLRLAFGLKTA